jgi:hypothetical protein
VSTTELRMGQEGLQPSTPFATGDRFGISVSALGDVDGDGDRDLAVGAYHASGSTGETWLGRAFVLLLDPAGLGAGSDLVTGVLEIDDTVPGLDGGELLASDMFGRSVAGVGDLDRNGVPDLVVGAHQRRQPGGGKGYLLLLERRGGLVAVDRVVKLASDAQLDADDRYGASVAPIGDLDRDGFVDLAVGAPTDDDGDVDAGAVWIHFLDRDVLRPAPPLPSVALDA